MRNTVYFSDPEPWVEFMVRALRNGLKFEAWDREAHTSGHYVVVLTGGY